MIDRFLGEFYFLNNFELVPVVVYGDTYQHLEGAFHASKWPPVVGNEPLSAIHAALRAEIRAARDPYKAKSLGQRRTPPIRQDWETWRLESMELLLRRKFGLEPHPTDRQAAALQRRLGERLALTAPHVLVEGNSHGDDFWGAVPAPMGVELTMEQIENLSLWKNKATGAFWRGENWLGRLLGKTRDEIVAA